MADTHCLDLGIPERLHTAGRNKLGLDNSSEKLYRRYNLETQATVTACFRFGDTSVNRAGIPDGVISLPEDALIDHETGKAYEGCGILAFDVQSLKSSDSNGGWKVAGVAGEYHLVAEHDPLRCNYAHVEISVIKDGKKQEQIKPNLIKLAIRRHLESKMVVVLPLGLAGETLPMER